MTTTQYNILLENGVKRKVIETLEAAFQSKENALSKEDLHNTELRLQKEIYQTKIEIKELDIKIEKSKAELQKEIQQSKSEMIKWCVGVGIGILLPMMSMLIFIFFKL